jgi:hypothetical protein
MHAATTGPALVTTTEIIIRGVSSAWPAAVVFTVPIAVLTAETNDRVMRTVAIAAGTPIRLQATVADVTITGSRRPDVGIDIVRRAPSAADLAKYPVSIEHTSEALEITAVQAGDGRDARLKTEIVIAAPADARFQSVRVFEGRVRLMNLRASCDVDLRRGPIEAGSLAGRIRLESGIGSIDLRDSELTPGGMMRLRVFNGALRVQFSRMPASARILALTFRGTITSDIPLERKETFGPRAGETTIGAGDPVMSMDVVYGDIVIRVGARR